MQLNREKEAISAYLKLLQNKGAKSGVLYKRSLFLDQLSLLLADKHLDRTAYGEALDTLMKTISADLWHDGLNTAREFYPFWMSDIKAIVAFSAQSGFSIDPLDWRPKQITLQALTDSLKKEKFSVTETRHLMAYTHALKDKSADKSIISSRLKLAQILLLRLRDAPTGDSRAYRVAVDLTLPLFNEHETKQLFLFVIREFYYFWVDSVKFSENLVKDVTKD